MPEQQWVLPSDIQPPEWFVEQVTSISGVPGHYAAKLLWQRGINDATQLSGFVNPQLYKPASPFEFGQEMQVGGRTIASGTRSRGNCRHLGRLRR
jgi:single-stranded-DNA-specific exonuclease